MILKTSGGIGSFLVAHRLFDCETFYYLLEWVRKTTESTEDTETNNNSLCSPCPLWLIFRIIRVHPEKIKKSLDCKVLCIIRTAGVKP